MTCLAKDPDDRWQSARDLMRELRWVADRGASLDGGRAAAQAAPRSPWSRALPWAPAGVLGVALLTALLMWSPWRSTPAIESPVSRFSILPPETHRFDRSTPPAVSLAETETGIYPFWSPDNKSIGFFAGGKLKKVNRSGGPATTLADAATGRGATWGSGGTIVFAPSIYSGLYQVAAAGGPVTRATRFEPGTPSQKFPCFLPDGRHFLYLFGAGGRDQQSIRIGSLDSIDDNRTLVNGVDSAALYAQGHVMFVRGTTLVARPFDAARQELTGEEFPVAEQVQATAIALQAWVFSASSNGVRVYQPAASDSLLMVWLDRAGARLGTVGEPGAIGGVRLWRRDGHELFHRAADNRVMAGDMDAKAGTLEVRKSRPCSGRSPTPTMCRPTAGGF